MKTIKKIKAKIVHVSNIQEGRDGKYFIIRLKGDDGIKYDVLPSENCAEYEMWKQIASDGIGKWFEGFQYQGEGKYGAIVNKHVLPNKLAEEETITNVQL